LELFTIGFLPVGIIDLLDIIAVTFVFYQIYQIMRGTRATQMFAGLLFLLVAGSVAQLVGMSGLTWLIQSIGAVWVIAFVILFAPELRRMLLQVGQMGLMRTLFSSGGQRAVNEVVRAAFELSRRRFGGLMVFQRRTGIRGVIETGVLVQAEISWQTLVSIFFPRTPLHDGAVIIIGDTVVAAACILPLSVQPNLDSSIGTRHRAALGITEEVDAVAVVVSEESGSVSVAVGGKFVGRDLDERSLNAELTQLLYPRSRAGMEDEEEPNPVPTPGGAVS
jgi:diadenylate cyclase